MKNVNVETDKCEHYKRGSKVSSYLTQETCITCHFMLFSHCWFDETKSMFVAGALNGFPECKQKLHDRLEKIARSR
jgi:hypothetical protein